MRVFFYLFYKPKIFLLSIIGRFGSMSYRRTNTLLGFILCSGIVSCSWMREAELPKTTSPSLFRSADSMNTNIESLPYLAWWQQFNDPILNNLIESSILNNLELQSSLQNLEQARGQLLQAKLSWIPTLDLLGGYTTNPSLGDIGTFFGAWPTYTLNIANMIQNQRYASYQVQEYEAMVNGVRLTLIAQVCSGYFTLIAQQQQLYLLNQLYVDIAKLVSLIEQQRKIGLDTAINVTAILAQQKQIQAQISLVKHNILVSNNSLKFLINENPGDIESINEFSNYDFNNFHPGDLPANVLANRPDIIMAQYSVQKSHAGVGVAFSNLFPSIQLDRFFGGGSINGALSSPDQYVKMTDAYLDWGISPATFGQIEAQKGAYYSQIYQYIQTVRKALRDTDNSFSFNNRVNEKYAHLSDAFNLINRKYNLQDGLYKSGLISNLMLTQNRIEVDNMKITLNQAKLEQALSLVNLYQELAGGYKYTYATESLNLSNKKYLNQD